MYDTVIFDLDGTLLDTLGDLASAVNYIQDFYGYPKDTEDVVKKHVGHGIRHLVKMSLPGGVECPVFPDAYEKFQKYYIDHCRVKTAPYEGIVPMLGKLKEAGIKTAIVSNKQQNAVETLRKEYFGTLAQIAIGEDEKNGILKKPAPYMVDFALEQLKSNKENTLYVGDSEVDVETAENAKIKCVLCAWGFRTKSFLETLNSFALIENPNELLDIVL